MCFSLFVYPYVSSYLEVVYIFTDGNVVSSAELIILTRTVNRRDGISFNL